MKSKHYQALGIGLFSSLALLTPQVMADETTPVTATASTEAVVASESSTSTEVTTNYTDDSQLNQAISEATTEGITAVETETETFESTQEAQVNYAEQTEMAREVTKDYQEAKATYQKAEQDYQTYQKQEQAYQDELVKYQEYEKKVQQYNVDEFRELLEVPKSYTNGEVTRRVLEPIQKELSNYFLNFKYKVIKSNKRGNPVLGYEFTWKPETTGEWEDDKYKKNDFYKPKTIESNVPDWVEKEYKHSATAEEQAKLEELRRSMSED